MGIFGELCDFDAVYLHKTASTQIVIHMVVSISFLLQCFALLHRCCVCPKTVTAGMRLLANLCKKIGCFWGNYCKKPLSQRRELSKMVEKDATKSKLSWSADHEVAPKRKGNLGPTGVFLVSQFQNGFNPSFQA